MEYRDDGTCLGIWIISASPDCLVRGVVSESRSDRGLWVTTKDQIGRVVDASALSDSSPTHELSIDSLLPALLRLSDALPEVDGRAWPPEPVPEPEPEFVKDALLDGRLAPERVFFDEGRIILRSEDLFAPGRGGMNEKLGIDRCG
jgi:hypothetical protein